MIALADERGQSVGRECLPCRAEGTIPHILPSQAHPRATPGPHPIGVAPPTASRGSVSGFPDLCLWQPCSESHKNCDLFTLPSHPPSISTPLGPVAGAVVGGWMPILTLTPSPDPFP